ncbi:hypothetical protein KJY77_01920 [Canibacter sp. lx-72]|uniref:hypothetical protein n=1 Tax=Canibacter zhuwentaonis TaxID=2837491 RepID=UPI001BDC469F|nr:hypothetical protein [Canibacter zhuwentaonis]MBT1017900.1 hypothetical protein [Canibacter zhuwentaonis]
MSSEPRRRSTFVDSVLNYAEVGGSQAPDLLDYPPNGAYPFAESVRLGIGKNRFDDAVGQLMTWRVFELAGYSVTVLDQGSIPARPSLNETVYSAEGTAYLLTGAKVELQSATTVAKNAVDLSGVYSVVRLLRGDRQEDLTGSAETGAEPVLRSGVVLGTVSSAREFAGEVSFEVQLLADDSVQAVARGFFHLPKRSRFNFLCDGKNGQKLSAEIKETLSCLIPGYASLNRVNGGAASAKTEFKTQPPAPVTDAF